MAVSGKIKRATPGWRTWARRMQVLQSDDDSKKAKKEDIQGFTFAL